MRALPMVALTLAVSCAGARAFAQRGERMTDATRQLAERHIGPARAAFQERRYDVAAREFEVAWELTHDPAFLFNAGAAWERVPDIDRALASLRRYLLEAPDSPATADVRARIAVLERSRPTVTAPATTAPAAVRAPTPTAPPNPSPRPHPWRYVAVAAGGVAVVTGVVAAAVFLDAQGDFRHLQDTCAPRCDPADAAAIDDRVTTANVFLGLTAATAALGVTALVVDLVGDRRERHVALAVTPRADGAVLTAAGSF